MMPPMAQAKRTLYEIVGIAPDASAEEISLACDERGAELRAQASHDASALALVRHARDVLTDPARRAAYDASLAPAAPAPATLPKPAADPKAQPGDAVTGEADEAAVEPARRAAPWGLIALGAAALLIVGLFVGRMMTNPVPPAPVVQAPKVAPPPPPAALTPAQLISAVSPSVARLQSVDLSGNVLPLGMAVATEAGLAVTTCHAIPANAQIVATFGAEKGAGTLVITDEILDLCKLSIAGAEPRPLPLSTQEVKAGDKVYVLSPDAPGSYALAEATVRQLSRSAQGETFQLSAKAANGAPVVDEQGHLLGIANGESVVPAAYIAQARSRSR
jgi:hypothetical protein